MHMTKAELVTAIADKAGLNKAQAKEALDAFIASVSTSLKAGKEVRLVGFGSFVPIKRPAGTARNPRTGEIVKRAASSTCRFRVGDALKSTLNR
jgi:DNA-binding protein HU-beta